MHAPSFFFFFDTGKDFGTPERQQTWGYREPGQAGDGRTVKSDKRNLKQSKQTQRISNRKKDEYSLEVIRSWRRRRRRSRNRGETPNRRRHMAMALRETFPGATMEEISDLDSINEPPCLYQSTSYRTKKSAEANTRGSRRSHTNQQSQRREESD